jgi:uncharacterized protein YkwD
MRRFLFLTIAFGLGLPGLAGYSQSFDSDPLNTAENANYMKPSEKEMIREINLLRSNPPGYIQYIDEYLALTKDMPPADRSTQRKYTLTFNYTLINGEEVLESIDTIWFDEKLNKQEAIASLRKELKSTKPLRILKPDKGIYEAVKYYAKDQDANNWTLAHVGSDGSWPWDRIKRFSPDMSEGNENIASRYPEPTERQIIILLLIDEGVPGYGHRFNLLDPKWTHVACFDAGLKNGMYRWLQNFGQKK